MIRSLPALLAALALSFLPDLVRADRAGDGPVGVILDTDMANDCDDAGALAVLNALADRGEAEILAVVTNRKDPGNASAAAVDVINTWYGRPDVPIGTDKDGAKTPKRWNKPSAYCGALRDEFPHDAKPDDEMPDALDVYRETLEARPDGSVVLCSVGALSNLEDLVRAEPELVKAKVRRLLVMGGGFPRTAKPETNIKLDPAAAVTVANEWPTPILWQGFEVGAAMDNGAELQDASEKNPVRRAYELRPYRGDPALAHGKPNHDLATVLLAVRSAQPAHWIVRKEGRAVVDSDGHTRWRRDRNEAHQYVRIRNHPRELEGILGKLLATPPAHRN